MVKDCLQMELTGCEIFDLLDSSCKEKLQSLFRPRFFKKVDLGFISIARKKLTILNSHELSRIARCDEER